MTTIITDFAELRKFASANSKRAWYKAFCTAWDDKGPREAQAALKTGARSVPRYRYRLDGKQHNYYPDMIVFTATRAHVVEVKSTYYLLRDLDKNLAKFSRATRRCLKQDRTFWLFCYLTDGSLVRVKNPTTKDQLRAAGIPVDGLR